jgi:uncharacterized protein (TIRG00374 family)
MELKKIIPVLKYILILGVGVGMLFLAFRGVKLKETIQEMAKANFFWIFVSVIASLIAFVSRTIRWNMLIEPLGYKPAIMNTCAALMIGYLANLAVPRLGEVTRCGTLSRTEKIPFDSLLGTVIIERIIDVLSLLVCMLLVAYFEYKRLGNFLNENIYSPAANKITSLLNSPLILSVLSAAIVVLLFLVLRKKNNSNGLAAKISRLLKGIINGVDTVRKLKSPAGFLFHTILIWFMYYLMSYTCFFALEATSHLDWHAGLFVLVAGGMGMSAPVQGGIGVYHLLVSQGLLLYGVLQPHGLAFATLMHTSQTLTVIILGGLAFLYLFLKKKNARAKLS